VDFLNNSSRICSVTPKSGQKILLTDPDGPIKSFFFPTVAREKSITMPKLKRDDIDRHANVTEFLLILLRGFDASKLKRQWQVKEMSRS